MYLTVKFQQSVKQQFSTFEITEEARTVDFYARQLSVHPNHLNAVLKKSTGLSPLTFIHQQVIDKAKTLLLQTHYSAKEIAWRLAFKDPAHFNTFFRKHTNQTPMKYREEIRNSAFYQLVIVAVRRTYGWERTERVVKAC